MKMLFFLVCIIEIIMQIYLVARFKKTKEANYWNVFMGITIASFISLSLAYVVFEYSSLGLSDALSTVFICGLSFICNIILLIVGLVIKNKINNSIIKLNKNSFFTGILVIIINCIVILVLPIIASSIVLKNGEKYIIGYLNNKYGVGNYRVINVYKDYSYNGMWDKSLSGYHYEMKSDYMKDTFIVTVDDEFRCVEDDYFLPVYYSQKYNLKYSLKCYDSIYYDFSEFENYLEKKITDQYFIDLEKIEVKDIYLDYVKSLSNIDGVEYSSNYYIVSDENGKIPTIEELINKLVEYIEYK